MTMVLARVTGEFTSTTPRYPFGYMPEWTEECAIRLSFDKRCKHRLCGRNLEIGYLVGYAIVPEQPQADDIVRYDPGEIDEYFLPGKVFHPADAPVAATDKAIQVPMAQTEGAHGRGLGGKTRAIEVLLLTDDRWKGQMNLPLLHERAVSEGPRYRLRRDPHVAIAVDYGHDGNGDRMGSGARVKGGKAVYLF